MNLFSLYDQDIATLPNPYKKSGFNLDIDIYI